MNILSNILLTILVGYTSLALWIGIKTINKHIVKYIKGGFKCID